jgi:ribosome-associated protein
MGRDMTDKKPNAAREVTVREEPIELCQFMKFGGLAATGGEAKMAITEGKVLLNGVVETQKRKKLRAGDKVTFDAQTLVVRIA